MWKFWKKGMPVEMRAFAVGRWILWLLPCLLLVVLLNDHYVPLGRQTIVYQVDHNSQVVRNFASKESDKLFGISNSDTDKKMFQLITVSPLYFDVVVPRPFQKATVSLTYQNPQDQEIIQLGVQQANGAYAYFPLAYANPTLDGLADYWSLINEGDTYFWQKNVEYYQNEKNAQRTYDSRKKKLDVWRDAQLNLAVSPEQQQQINDQYQTELDQIAIDTAVAPSGSVQFASVEDFLHQAPPRDQIAQYNYDLSPYFDLPGYTPSNTALELKKSIRGKHELYTYIADDEALDFSFVVQDINRHAGEDPIIFTVVGPDNTIVKKVVEPDDGNAAGNGVVKLERTVHLLVEGQRHGVYKITLDTNDDVFFKRIITFQHLLMFHGSVYMTDNVEYSSVVGDGPFSPTRLYTTSTAIGAYSSHQQNLQTLRIGSKDMELTIPNEFTEIDGLSGTTVVYSSKNDVYVRGDGFFAFDPDQMFDTNISHVISVKNVKDIDEYNYIIATYPQPSQSDGWLTASAQVEVPQLYFDKGKDTVIHFMVNLPNMHETGKTLKVKSVKVVFEKPPVTATKIFEKIKSIFKK